MKSKKRVKKDPNAPKKALSAYMLWLNQTRDEIKKDNPGISITELSKKAGVLWKALEDKSVCIDLHTYLRSSRWEILYSYEVLFLSLEMEQTCS